MQGKPVIVWIVLSIVAWLTGSIWRNSDPESQVAFMFHFLGWVSTLLSVGFYSTPSRSVFGKVSFGFVVFMVTGIVMKLLHLPGANEIIVIGLFGIAITYGVMWARKKRSA